MRWINEIILHCSATYPGQDIGAKEITHWHKERGFNTIGYHYVIRLDGTLETGRPLSMAGAHCTSHNLHSIGICYVGGCDKNGKPADTRTSAQRATLIKLLEKLRKTYSCTIHGHNEYADKACPCFDVRKEFPC